MTLDDINYVDVQAYDTDELSNGEDAFEANISDHAIRMQNLIKRLLETNQKQLLLDILEAIRGDIDHDYFVVHQSGEIESIQLYIERLTS